MNIHLKIKYTNLRHKKGKLGLLKRIAYKNITKTSCDLSSILDMLMLLTPHISLPQQLEFYHHKYVKIRLYTNYLEQYHKLIILYSVPLTTTTEPGPCQKFRHGGSKNKFG
jgi:hypothetical protein